MTPVQRVCPECGKDPSAGWPRPPWACRATGLPLWAALIMVAGLAVMASRHIARPMSRYATAHFGYAAIPGFTAGEFRAAADGDAALAQRVAEAALGAIGRGGTGTARVEAAPIAGHGQVWAGYRLGWPVGWIGWRRGGYYSDMVTLSSAAVPVAPDNWRWVSEEAMLFGQWAGGGPNESDAWLQPGALVLNLTAAALICSAAALAMRSVQKRWSRGPGRVACIVGVGVAVAVALTAPRRLEIKIPNIYKPEDEPLLPMLGELRALAADPAGGVRAAALLAGDRMDAHPGQPVVVQWFATGQNTRGFGFGWPSIWLRASTDDPPGPTPHGLDLSEWSLRWLKDSGSAEWRAVDRAGQVRAVQLNLAAFAASLAPVALIAALPLGLWRLGRRVRRRRWARDGRCFTCGYEVGRSTGGEPEPESQI